VLCVAMILFASLLSLVHQHITRGSSTSGNDSPIRRARIPDLKGV
jgi:hypothetical protein